MVSADEPAQSVVDCYKEAPPAGCADGRMVANSRHQALVKERDETFSCQKWWEKNEFPSSLSKSSHGTYLCDAAHEKSVLEIRSI